MRNFWRIMWVMERTIADYCETFVNRHFVKNASPRPPHGGGFCNGATYSKRMKVCDAPRCLTLSLAPTRAGADIFNKALGLL
jgi:hypothetical protein